MTETRFAPERIVAALNASDVAYVVVGAWRSPLIGVVRATRDLDLVPEPSAENLDRLASTLADLGAEHPIAGPLTAPALARPISFFKVGTRFGEVQVLNRMPSVPPYVALRKGAITVELAAATIATVCSLADLRRSPPAVPAISSM